MTTALTKRCPRCGLTKDRSEFRKAYCKPCEAEYNSEYQKTVRKKYKNDPTPKRCNKCGEMKTRADFYSIHGKCKECANAQVTALNRERNIRRNPNYKPKEILPKGKSRCSRCKEIFNKEDIKYGKCKPCLREYQRERYHEAKQNRDPNELKVCGKCNIEKPLSEYTNPIYNYCRDCNNEYQRLLAARAKKKTAK